MHWLAIIALAVAACLAVYFGTRALLAILHRRQVLDHPNHRSSHDRPVPRGGGIAVMAVAVVGCWLAALMDPGDSRPLLIIALLAGALAGFSFIDDLRGLPAAARLILQVLAIAMGCSLLPDAPVFQGLLPPWADRLAAGVCWLWFVNLYNFMDGIDGISVVETASIGLGIAAVALLTGAAPELAPPAAVITGAIIGFAFWNWPPARIFLGDVGSVGLGYLLGWLLLALATRGQWAAALLLPLYYLSDASWTLIRRLIRGEKAWRAHRSHFYQYAARRFGSHAKVSRSVLYCNAALLIAALAAALTGRAAAALLTGGVAVGILLWYFAKVNGKTQHDG